jgi:hypothetical protein
MSHRIAITLVLSLAAPLAAAAEPSLDDLLNIPAPSEAAPKPMPAPDSTTPAPDSPAVKPDAAKPEIEMPKEKTGDLFMAATAEMKLAASQLTEQHDSGIQTQRTQESVIRKLDQLLDQLRQQQQGKGKSQQEAKDTGSEKNQSQQQQQAQRSSQSSDSRDNDTRMELEDGQRNDQPLSEKLSEWGNLPPRLRDQLLQGSEDRFSGLYRQLTERYYQRLAEESQ